MSYWSVPPIWAGETVCILACGPSRKLVDMNRLQRTGMRTIAINDSFRAPPWADILYFCDMAWWESRKFEISRGSRGVTYTFGEFVTLENQIPGVHRLRNTGPLGFDPDPSCLRHGSNSGYQALHLACHLGAKRVILFGFDLRIVEGQLHAEERPERQDVNGFAETLAVMLEKFPSIVEPLAERGIEVINASPGSALKCWPIVEPDEVLTSGSLGLASLPHTSTE